MPTGRREIRPGVDVFIAEGQGQAVQSIPRLEFDGIERRLRELAVQSFSIDIETPRRGFQTLDWIGVDYSTLYGESHKPSKKDRKMNTYSEFMKLSDTQRGIVLSKCSMISDRDVEAEFLDTVNECNKPIKLCGLYEYGQGTLLKAVDPVAFRTGLNDWLGTSDDYIELEGNTYRVSEIEAQLFEIEDAKADYEDRLAQGAQAPENLGNLEVD